MKNEKTLDKIFGEMKDLHDNFLTAAEQLKKKKKEPKFKEGDFVVGYGGNNTLISIYKESCITEE